MNIKTQLFLLGFAFCFIRVSYSQQNDSLPSHRLFLIGDAGQEAAETKPYQIQLKKMLSLDGSKTILFLGDNIYPIGMPPQGARSRKLAEDILMSQINMVKATNATTYFIPGNHDWQQGGKAGGQYILNQQNFIDSIDNKSIHFLPRDGCPGPVEVKLLDEVILVIIDSQWFFQKEKSKSCSSLATSQAWQQLIEILDRNKNKQVIVAAHHPVMTGGPHGGHFTLQDHLFPLTRFNNRLILPLPILGSLYVGYRKIFGGVQDTSNPTYKMFIQDLQPLLAQFPGIIYVSGHEHTLQYLEKENVRYVVSGAGSKSSPVKKIKNGLFASSQNGFAVISFWPSNALTIEYFTGSGEVFKAP